MTSANELTMSPQPKKDSFEETAQHTRPSLRIGDRKAAPKRGLWQRVRSLFKQPPATSTWLPAVSAEHSMPTLEPLALSYPHSEDFSFLEDEESDQNLSAIAANNPGTLILFSCLDLAFDNRPFDVPFYTARKGRALITLLFSEKTLPGETTLDRVVAGDLPMALNLSAFGEGESPILRASLMFPDKLRSPLIFESMLNLRNEDVQEFLYTVLESDEIDLLLRHESNLAATIDLSVSVPRLSELVRTQVALLGSGWSKELSPSELSTSGQAVARVYRSSDHASDGDRGVKLRRIGRAKCLLR